MARALVNGKVFFQGNLVDADILIENGRIAAVEKGVEADEKIDIAGNVVLPGLVDCHVHFREPGETQKEDFLSGSRAAAAGGVTTVLDMPNNRPPVTTVALLEEKRERAKKSIVNYGFHFGATEENSEEIRKAENIAAVKVVMGATTGGLLVESDRALEAVFRSGKRVVVHAEDNALLKRNEERYATETSPGVHGRLRSREVAETATAKALTLAARYETRLHVAHLTTAKEVEMVADAKRQAKVSCEVTPHHLFLTEEAMGRLGNFAKMNPPLRRNEDVAALWKGLNDGTIDVVASDHAPHLRGEKEREYREAPAGVPGVETLLPLLLTAVNEGRLSLRRLVEVTAQNPARIFGLRRKGVIEVGEDADLVVVNMNEWKTIKNSNVVSKCGWTPFDGKRVKGVPVMTIVSGNVVWKDGTFNETGGKEVDIDS